MGKWSSGAPRRSTDLVSGTRVGHQEGVISKLKRRTSRSLPREGRVCQAGGTPCDWGLGLEGAWKVRRAVKLSAWLEWRVRDEKY